MKWTGKNVSSGDGKDPDDGNGGGSGGDGGIEDDPLGQGLKLGLQNLKNQKLRIKGCAVYELLKCKVIDMKKTIWDKILKIVIAVASAVLGALGANTMNM